MDTDYIKKILQAQVYDVASESPLTYAHFLSKRLNNTVMIKREDLQEVFSFKLRGAYNKMSLLTKEQREAGVIAASAGNHAQGVALAAMKLGIEAVIVMPETTPDIKVMSVRERGGKVVLFGDNFSEALGKARELEEENGYTFIHPYDDPEVIAGQGTIGMEICRQHNKPIHAIFVPVGGGGLAAGIATYIKYLRPDIQVIGVESEESACLKAALDAGERVVLDKVGIFADGVAVAQIGEETFRLCQKYVDDVITISTDEICAAIKDLFEDTRSIAEPSGALALAGLKKYCETTGVTGETMVAIESGANVNFDRLRYISEVSEVGEQREYLLAISIPEVPGSFRTFSEIVHDHNVTEFNYRMSDPDKAVIFAGVEMLRGSSELPDLISKLDISGYGVVDLTKDNEAKLHIRHMVGGRLPEGGKSERLYKVVFPERAGALEKFLTGLKDRWNISLFHYRNKGGVFGRVLIGLQHDDSETVDVINAFETIGFDFEAVSKSPAYDLFLK